MGFLKDLGTVAGKIAGAAIGGTVYLAGEIVNSDLIREVGEGAYKATANTGKIVGSITEGAVDVITGTISSDNKKIEQGFDQVIDTSVKTVAGIGKGIGHVVEKGADTVGAIIDGDTEKAMKTGKELAKVALVSTFAVGVCDVIDGVIDGDIFDGDDVDELIENPNTHHVDPYWRHYADGSKTWVDGDGDSTVDTFDGWTQHNPDYRV